MDAALLSSIRSICTQGYERYAYQDYDTALRFFYQAWLKLPKPQTEQQEAESVLAAIGDTYYRMGKYELAMEALRSALACPQTATRPLVEMRLGQTLLDTAQEPQAIAHLQRAYRLGGDNTFENEDPKYKIAIKNFI